MPLLKLSQVRDILQNWWLIRALQLEKKYLEELKWNTSWKIKWIIKFYSWNLSWEEMQDELDSKCRWCNDMINKEVQDTLIDEIKELRRNKLLTIFFEIISRKIRRWNFYSSENLLEKLWEILEKIFPNTIINIYSYIWWRNWVIDCVNKSQNWRKVFSHINELENPEKIKLWLQTHKKFHTTNNHSWLICYKPIPELWNAVIFSFEWCCEEELEMIKYLMEALSETIIQWLEKINDKYINEVTWCKNRNFFNEHREDRSFSVIAIDLNDFKSINDKYWHSQWDKVLREFWKLLKSCVRENEWEVVHFSWDEFWILVKLWKNTEYISIMQIILDRIDKLVETWFFSSTLTNSESWIEENISINFSIWVCENKLWKWNQTLETCYKQADMDMLRAKDPSWFINRLTATFKHLKKDKIISTLNHIAKHFWIEIVYKEKTK